MYLYIYIYIFHRVIIRCSPPTHPLTYNRRSRFDCRLCLFDSSCCCCCCCCCSDVGHGHYTGEPCQPLFLQQGWCCCCCLDEISLLQCLRTLVRLKWQQPILDRVANFPSRITQHGPPSCDPSNGLSLVAAVTPVGRSERTATMQSMFFWGDNPYGA